MRNSALTFCVLTASKAALTLVHPQALPLLPRRGESRAFTSEDAKHGD
jgi:hypothetical protein